MRAAARWLVLLALAGGSAACIEPDLVPCGDGRACAPGLVCDQVHLTCVTHEQQEVCTGLPQHAACVAGLLEGLCFDGVCLAPGCGNRAVDPGEQCDDGNDVDGDGCTADCLSDESCNNGVLDPGEACDDGNLVSHDGCSSRCEIETVQWTTIPVHPYSSTYAAAYDQVRHRLVVARNHTVWEWDGSTWTLVRDNANVESWGALVWDSDRKTILGIGVRGVPNGPVIVVVPIIATWDGTHWTEITVTNRPLAFPPGKAAYDPVRGVVQVLTPISSETKTYDPATATWANGATLPFNVDGTERMTFDVTRGKILLVGAGGTCEPNGATWDCLFTFPPGGGTLVYEQKGGHVIALATNGEAYSYDAPQWLGTGINLPDKQWSIAWQDTTTGVIGMIGPDSTYTVDGTTVTDHTAPKLEYATVVFDPLGDQLVAIDENDNVWRRDPAAWTSISPGTGTLSNRGQVTFDPVRGGLLFVNATTQGVWKFTTSWTQILADQAFDPGAIGYTLAYDYARQQPVRVSFGYGVGPESHTYALQGATPPQWVEVGDAPVILAASYDATTQHLIGVANSGQLHRLDYPSWVAGLPFGTSSYQPVALPERRSTLLVPSGFLLDIPIVEMIGPSVVTYDPMPVMDSTRQGGAFAWSYGRTVIPSLENEATLLMIRQLVSATPDESCIDIDDLDTDGASGCADPDCWQKCFPACPLATSSCL